MMLRMPVHQQQACDEDRIGGALDAMRARDAGVRSAFSAAAKTDSRPCAFRRPSLVAGYFLLLAQKKVTKEKGTLASAVTRASCPRDYASRLRGSPTARPCADVELAGILPAIAARLFLRLLAAAERDPGRAKSAAVLPQKQGAEARRLDSNLVVPANAGTQRLCFCSCLQTPLKPRR